jgi:hypothetical protein
MMKSAPKTGRGGLLRTAYHKLTITNHPDRGGDPDVFEALVEAFEVLKNDIVHQSCTGMVEMLDERHMYLEEVLRAPHLNG